MKIKTLSRSLVITGLIAALLVSVKVSAGTFPAQNRNEIPLLKAKVQAAQFLSHATFGPTTDNIDALAAKIVLDGHLPALEEWINDQFLASATEHMPLAKAMIKEDQDEANILNAANALDTNGGVFNSPDYLASGFSYNRYKFFAWWDTAISAPDQLRQRMAWALAQIFVVSDNGSGFGSRAIDTSNQPQYLGIVNFYDMLVNNAFGSYRQTLEEVTLHPVMGVFLSSVRNRKASADGTRYPDENYAREVQQLFTIGLYQLNNNGVIQRDAAKNQIETYTNEDVKNFARVFTGLRYAQGNNPKNSIYTSVNLHDPMEMFESEHDMDEKILLGGQVLPAGQTGMQDISDALDNLFNHSNVGPFIARRLIQRFVKSNPSKTYVKAVAAAFDNNGSGVRGDFKAVIKAVLLHNEAINNLNYKSLRKPYGLLVTSKGTEHSRFQEPVIRYTAMIRALNGASQYHTGRYMIQELQNTLNQQAYKPHHVFNFYGPDDQAPGVIGYESRKLPNNSLYTPEAKILTSVAINNIANRLYYDLADLKADYANYINWPDDDTVAPPIEYPRITFDADIRFDILDDANGGTTLTNLAGTPDALMTHLDLLLCYGSMSDSAKTVVASAIDPVLSGTTATNREKVTAAILAVLMSPSCAVAN